jgi:hypothetical protein
LWGEGGGGEGGDGADHTVALVDEVDDGWGVRREFADCSVFVFVGVCFFVHV